MCFYSSGPLSQTTFTAYVTKKTYWSLNARTHTHSNKYKNKLSICFSTLLQSADIFIRHNRKGTVVSNNIKGVSGLLVFQ